MSKVKLEIEVPGAIEGTRLKEKFLSTAQRLIQEQTVLRLYQEGEISTGKGAEMLGLPLYDFIKLLGQHQISIFNLTEEELAQDVKNALAASRPTPKPRTKKR